MKYENESIRSICEIYWEACELNWDKRMACHNASLIESIIKLIENGTAGCKYVILIDNENVEYEMRV